MNFEQAIRQTQVTLIVMAEIQRRQAEIQQTRAEEIALQAEFVLRLQEGMDLHEKRMRHIDLTLAEVGDKLNGLIGFGGGFFPKPE